MRHATMAERTQPVSAPTPQPVSTATDASTARFGLPAGEFALASLFESVPDARVEIEPAVANPDDHALLVVKTDGHNREVDAALRSDPNTAAVEHFGNRGDSWRYRVTWKGRPQRLIQQLIAADVSVVSVQGRSGEWELRLLAPDREGIAKADEIMNDLDCGADCQQILTAGNEYSTRSGLTTEQREALVTAFEKGYYNVPRDATATDVADDLDISHQALSERLRRAHRHLVETELIVSEDEAQRL